MEEKTGIISDRNMESISSFTLEEKKLLKKYLEEYNDMYQKILILSTKDFVEKLIKHIELSLRSKINKYSLKSRNKVQEFVIEKIYQSDYKNAQIIQNEIEKRNRYELSKNYFKGEIIPHCDKDKKNGFYIHSCGERFQTYKYKISYDYYIMNLDKENKVKDINTNHYANILFCKKCKMLYKSSLIRFKCDETGIDFYSKISLCGGENDEDNLPFATWSKYHCNVVINDLMRCHKCKNNLFLLRKKIKNKLKKYIFCKKCNKIWLPDQLCWECIICKKKFSCDAKDYNPLEFKTLKICIKDALTEKIRAFPNYLDCKCKIDFSETIFFHRESCKGELFFGELNSKKTVICSKCDSIGFYDEYIWTCPICLKKTKNILRENKFEDKNIENYENKSALHRRIQNDEEIENDKDNISVSKVTNDSSYRKRRFFNLFKNDKNKKEDFENKDLINSISNNNYQRKKIKDIIINKDEDDSVEKRDFHYKIKIYEKKEYNTIIKDENENININNIYKKDFIHSRNFKENYKNLKKKYITNIDVNTRLKTDINDNNNILTSRKINKKIGKLFSINNKIENKSENKNNINKNIMNNKKENSILKRNNLIDIGNSNIKDIENILNKFAKKININLNYNSSGMNFHRPSCKQIINKSNLSIENKDKEAKVSKNKTTIDDIKTEQSEINSNNIGENIKRKESFISEYNKFKKSSRLSRILSSKMVINENINHNNKNILFKSLNENNNNLEKIKNGIKKDEYSKLKKRTIFQRYKKINNINNNNINIENKSNNILIQANNENINNKKESIIENNYPDNYNNKKGSNSTEADSEKTTKIIYHIKNPKQSFQIRKINTNINKNINNFDINDYKIIKKIGQGSFGQIFQIEDKYMNKFAMKKIIANSEKDIKKIEHEYQILIDLNIKKEEEKPFLNLVKIYGYSSKQLDPTTYVIYVLMELAITDWEKEIISRQKTKNYYSEKELMSILSSLIYTFAEMQKKNISHRDIKPQNILLFKDNKYKLADFGEAKELLKNKAPTNKQTLRGTELYMAPTLFHALQSKKIIKYINHNPYKSDVFSFGLCSLLAASLSFESIYDIRELNNNVSIHAILEKYLGKNYSFDVINIISQMLDINETTRKDFIEMQNEFESIGYKCY